MPIRYRRHPPWVMSSSRSHPTSPPPNLRLDSNLTRYHSDAARVSVIVTWPVHHVKSSGTISHGWSSSTMIAFNVSDIPVVPTLVATLLAGHGFRKRSLSPSGAIAAFFTGVVMLSPPLKSFGISLIVFYLVGSRATKFGKSRKAQLEEGHQEAGYRSANQVFCNSFSAMVATLIWSATFVPNSLASQLLPSLVVIPGQPYSSTGWCPLSSNVTSGLSRSMLLISLGYVQGLHVGQKVDR
jgi:hypothetical protein